jgi:ABC-type uncharacterized transport system permease subunit
MTVEAMRQKRWRNLALMAGGGLAVAAAVAALLAALGVPPGDAAGLILDGAFGSPSRVAYVLTAWAPLLLCAAGLLVTFAAGLWNIGIEGQVVLGAVCATGTMFAVGSALPPAPALTLAALAGAAGGALWAAVAGGLKIFGRVHEIFGGLGLNFIAGSLTVYLVLGPWKRPGIGSTGGTEPFPPDLWLPAPAGFPVSPVELLLALAAIVTVGLMLRGTRPGLRLRAIGKNPRAAFLMGVPTGRYTLLAFAACGALAGLAGWILVAGAGARHNLFPLISGGTGFLAILVVLLAGYRPGWTAPIAFFFAVLLMGGLQLALQRQLDSSLAGVIQGLLVLGVLAARGLRARAVARGGGA